MKPEQTEYTLSRRNFVLGVINGAGYHVGMMLVSPSMAGAVFVARLTDRKWAVGLVYSLMMLGWVWPQLILSNMMEHVPRKKPFYVVSAVTRIAIFGLILLSMWGIGDSRPGLLFWVYALLTFLFSSMAGVGIIPFMDIVGKSIPPNRRASFFSFRQFFACLLIIPGRQFVKAVLAEDSGLAFPVNYLIIFGAAFVSIAVSAGSFCLCSEPAGMVSGGTMRLRQRIRRGWRIFRRDRYYRRYYVVRAGFAFAGMCAPLYSVYAIESLGAAEDRIGDFMLAGALSALALNFLWRHVGDRYGSRLLLLCAGGLGLASPLIALAAPAVPAAPLPWVDMDLRLAVYLLVYATAFPAMAGTGTAMMSYLLEIAPDARRPTYVGFMYTIAAPLAFVGWLGGYMADISSPRVVFALAAALAVAVLLFVRSMDEPRRSRRLASRYAQWESSLRADGVALAVPSKPRQGRKRDGPAADR